MVWVRLPVYSYKRNETYYFSRSTPSDLQLIIRHLLGHGELSLWLRHHRDHLHQGFHKLVKRSAVILCRQAMRSRGAADAALFQARANRQNRFDREKDCDYKQTACHQVLTSFWDLFCRHLKPHQKGQKLQSVIFQEALKIDFFIAISGIMKATEWQAQKK